MNFKCPLMATLKFSILIGCLNSASIGFFNLNFLNVIFRDGAIGTFFYLMILGAGLYTAKEMYRGISKWIADKKCPLA
ncbi:MAG: hypothetical protein JJV93_01525 [Alphaproteobacteria bacterium]|nr:hypothetical protein [Alphaproteobacteria bacterium]MBL0717928.1 hypothetical protein [Alphaproteobacteria bacterium]